MIGLNLKKEVSLLKILSKNIIPVLIMSIKHQRFLEIPRNNIYKVLIKINKLKVYLNSFIERAKKREKQYLCKDKI